MVEEGTGPFFVLVFRLGRRGAELVGVLNEFPAAAGHGFGPPALLCESQAQCFFWVLVICREGPP